MSRHAPSIPTTKDFRLNKGTPVHFEDPGVFWTVRQKVGNRYWSNTGYRIAEHVSATEDKIIFKVLQRKGTIWRSIGMFTSRDRAKATCIEWLLDEQVPDAEQALVEWQEATDKARADRQTEAEERLARRDRFQRVSRDDLTDKMARATRIQVRELIKMNEGTTDYLQMLEEILYELTGAIGQEYKTRLGYENEQVKKLDQQGAWHYFAAREARAAAEE